MLRTAEYTAVGAEAFYSFTKGADTCELKANFLDISEDVDWENASPNLFLFFCLFFVFCQFHWDFVREFALEESPLSFPHRLTRLDA